MFYRFNTAHQTGFSDSFFFVVFETYLRIVSIRLTKQASLTEIDWVRKITDAGFNTAHQTGFSDDEYLFNQLSGARWFQYGSPNRLL